ncbi:MAG: Hint domain-containing protein [Paracoccaceae bacterium]
MPKIKGTAGNDTIDVTNDVGTLNGVAGGTPINAVFSKGGDDTITVTDSTITGHIGAGQGNDTVTLDGSSLERVGLGAGDDTVNLINSTVSDLIDGVNGTDTLNLQAGSVIVDDIHGTITVVAGTSYNLSSGTVTLPAGNVVTYKLFENGTGLACFLKGTQIITSRGEVAVEALKVGDMLQTLDNGLVAIQWIGARALTSHELIENPEMAPIRIKAGALCHNTPNKDLYVSPQHRILIRSPIAERMFKAQEVLIPAVKLLDHPGIERTNGALNVEYFHILCKDHQVIISNGAPTESFYAGPLAMKSLSSKDYDKVSAILDEPLKWGKPPKPARLLVRQKSLIKNLLERHKKNQKSLLEASA